MSGRAPALRAYDPGQPLFFLHVPKTGGTSLSVSLAEWFPGRVLSHYRHDAVLPPRHAPGPGEVVAGHFNRMRGFGLDAYYPGAPQALTVLRQPFERFVSQWLYLGARRSPLLGDAQEAGFATWFERRADAFARGEDDFAMAAQFPGDGLPEDRLVAVGLTERMDETLRVFAAALGRAPVEAPAHVNRTGLAVTPFEPWREAHRAAFAAEYALYDRARALFDLSRRTYL